MKAAPGRLLIAAVIATTLALIVFTVQQYRSSREVTEATGIRLADTLQMSLVNWHVEFERQFTELTGTVDRQAAGRPGAAGVREAIDAWRASARHPGLLRSAAVSGCGADDATPIAGTAPARHPALPAPPAPGTWVFLPDGPALARPWPGGDRCWLVLMLDAGVLARDILPDLALRYFAGTDGLDYDVALFAGGPALYASSAEFGQAPAVDADGILNVFARRSSPRSGGPYEVFHTVPGRPRADASAITWFALPPAATEADDWRLVVRHRRGGALGAFLANAQRRDLLTTLGSLALLVTAITLLVIASHRAQRLAQLQMNFVTAVSHELRTPLTVIGSAADNIARGVVREPSHVAEYGGLIGQQSRQLGSLVERILLFASQTAHTPAPALEPLSVADALDSTLTSVSGLLAGAGFQVERQVDAAVPGVLADAGALAHCLENLLTNAVKYSGPSRWIGVRVSTGPGPSGAAEVRVAISDRGLGIAAAEQGRIFEPFYRSPSVVAAQIHGTGLGLALARSLAERMAGRVSVVSTPGQGSTFTLHLPAAPARA